MPIKYEGEGGGLTLWHKMMEKECDRGEKGSKKAKFFVTSFITDPLTLPKVLGCLDVH